MGSSWPKSAAGCRCLMPPPPSFSLSQEKLLYDRLLLPLLCKIREVTTDVSVGKAKKTPGQGNNCSD